MKKIKYTKVNSIYIKEAKSINSVLMDSIKDLNLEDKLTEKYLMNFWKELFGLSIVNSTKSIQLKGKTLIIKMNSSVIKSEMMMLKSQILEKFQEKFGSNKIYYINIY